MPLSNPITIFKSLPEERMPLVRLKSTQDIFALSEEQLRKLFSVLQGSDTIGMISPFSGGYVSQEEVLTPADLKGADTRTFGRGHKPSDLRENIRRTIRTGLERLGSNQIIKIINAAPELFDDQTIAEYRQYAENPESLPLTPNRPSGQSGAVLAEPIFGAGVPQTPQQEVTAQDAGFAAQPAAQQKRATLVHPDGRRVAVDVGSQEAQQYFGQGFVLETKAPTKFVKPVQSTFPTEQKLVKRDLAAEQKFVKNWKGKGGQLPTPAEVNQGIYGTPNPQFTTPQGVQPPITAPTMPVGATEGQKGGITFPGEPGQVFPIPDQTVSPAPDVPKIGEPGALIGPTWPVDTAPPPSTEISPAQAVQQLADTSKLPANITDADWYKILTPEQKNLVALNYNAMISGNETLKADAQKALDEAVKWADPYFREQIRIVQDELLRGVTGTAADAQAQVGRLQTRMNQLKEDLTFNREQLTLEQQAEMAAQLSKYQGDLQNLQMTLTEAGLAFSSPRQQAEQQLAAQQAEIAESTGRKFRRSLREIETGTLRQTQEAAQQIADVTRKGGESIIEQLRKTEQQIGTAKLPTVSGIKGQEVTSLGGVTGTIEEQRQRAILDLQKTLLGRTTPFNLPNL